ncbi:MAG: cytochrome c [Roseiarcus sp.]|jgi:cytochrome c556
MNRILIVAAALAIGVQAAAPQNTDVIKERRDTMKQAGGAVGPALKMMKGETPFDLGTAQASLRTIIAVAAKMPSLFPDDSRTGGDTRALPAVWESKADVEARYFKLGQDATAALATVKDKESFGPAFQAVLKNCGGCHEKYRTPDK